MNRRLICVCCAACLFSFSRPCVAQARSTQALVQQLASPQPLEREAAFEELRQQPGAFAAPGMAAVLLQLARRENDLVVSTLRASNSRDGVSVKYGEGFGAYEGDVWSACWRFCNDHPALLAIVLANARSGVLAAQDEAIRALGDFGLPNRGFSDAQRARIDSALLAAASDRSAFFAIRESGVRAVAQVVRGDSHLAPDVKARFHRAIIAAVADSTPDVRQEAVRDLADFGDPSDLALLNEVAAHDTAHSLRNDGKQSYFVREEARRAIAKLSASPASARPPLI